MILYTRTSELLLLFCRSVYRHSVVPVDVVVSLLIQSLISSSQSILVEQLILSGVIPVSPATACSLLAEPATQQLGLDMLKRGGGKSEHVAEVLLAQGEIVEALHCHTIEHNFEFKVKKYLDFALKMGDQTFRDIFRHFEAHNFRSVNAASNKQPPLVIDKFYRDVYHQKFGEEDLSKFIALLSIK